MKIKKLLLLITATAGVLICSTQVWPSGANFNLTDNVPVTSAPVGVGTWMTIGGSTVITETGNVGINTTLPGEALDVVGTVRASVFYGSGTGLTSVSGTGWTPLGTNVTLTTATNNVGLGTTSPQGSFVVTNGNVGIGTWDPQASLSVRTGNVGIGTWPMVNNTLQIVGIGTSVRGSGLAVMDGNVGIGTWVATRALMITRGGVSVSQNQNTSNVASFVLQNTTEGIKTVDAVSIAENQNLLASGTDANNSLKVTLSNILNNSSVTFSGSVLNVNRTLQAVGAAGVATITGPLAYFDDIGCTGAAGGTCTTSGDVVRINQEVTTNTGTVFNVTTAGSGNVVRINDDGTYTDSTPFMIDAAGNIGIGTVTALTKLTVASGNVGLGTFLAQTGFVSMDNVGIGTWTAAGGNLIVKGGGNVGIGSSWPGRTLDVAGDIRATSSGVFYGDGSGLTNITTAVGWTASGTNIFLSTSTNNIGLGTTTPQAKFVVHEGNVGINTITADGGSLIVKTGNVGIGSSWPGTELDVQGTVRASVFYGSGAGLTSVSGTGWSPSGTNVTLTSLTNNVGLGTAFPQTKFAIHEGNVGINTIVADGGSLIVKTGNVGIGTSWPGASLDVAGTFRGRNNSRLGPSTGAGSDMISNGNGSFVGGFSWVAGGTSAVITSNGSGTFAYGLAQASLGGTTPSITSSGSGTIAMGYASGADMLSSGNGSFTMGYANSGDMTSSGFGSFVMGLATTGTMQSTGLGSFAMGQDVQATANNAFAVGKDVVNSNASTFMVGFNTAPTMTITSANVGIGTIAPLSKLIVTGGGLGVGTNVNSSFIQTSAPNGGLIVENNIGIGTTTPQAQLVSLGNVGIGTWTAAGGNLIVKGGGNVGIGSSWPGAEVDVVGTVRATAFYGSGAGLTSVSGTGWSPSGTNVTLTSLTNNVGVGTAFPQTKLSIHEGNVGINSWTADGGSLIVKTGNVGIGSSWPGSALDVNGLTRSTRFSTTSATASGTNATALGQIITTGSITASGNGSLATGYANAGAILASQLGAFAGGEANLGSGSAATLTSSGIGSIAYGYSIANTSSTSALSATNSGSVALGYVQEFGSPSTLLSSGLGSVAMGESFGGTLQSTGSGSIAMGFAGIGATLQSTGQGSVAMGENVQATANNAVALGSSVINNNASTFMVGFNPIPTMTVTSANVGIGTIAPLSKLIVTGGGLGIGTNVNSSFIQTSAPNGGLIVENNIGVGTTTPQAKLAVLSGNVGIGTWTAAGGNLIVNGGGNVGIGSAWPGTELDVQGTVRASVFYGSGAGLTSVSGTGWSPSGTNVTLTSATNNVGLGTTQPQGALVVNNGNVGIGTWAAGGGSLIVRVGNVGIGSAWPGRTLDVAGDIRATSSGVFYGDGAGLTNITTSAGWTASGTNVFVTTGSNNVGLGTTTPQTALAVNNGNVGIGTWTAAGGNLIVKGGGNVGIGSSWPGTELDVQGTVRATAFYGSGAGLTSIATAAGWTASGANVYLTSATNNVGIGTTSPQGGFVVMNGNVGIGTWVPASILDIKTGPVRVGSGTVDQATGPGDVYVADTLEVDGSVWLGDASTDNLTVVGTMNLSAANLTNLEVTGNTFLGTISGNVGINTTVADAALEIVKSGANPMLMVSSSAAGNGNYLIVSNGGNVGVSTLNPLALFEVNGPLGNPFAVTSTGNVGIGTYDPQTALAITGGNIGIGTWTSSALFQINRTAGNPFVVTSAGNTGVGTISPQGAFTVVSGNVGINTWSPVAVFQVNQPINKPFVVTSGGNIGMGTFDPQTALAITSGNIGIGTWLSSALLQVNRTAGSPFVVTQGGNVGIGTVDPQTTFAVAGGNTGIGTWTSSALLQVNRTIGNPFVVTQGGNVGIGTIDPQTSLAVAGGNVGIGTWTSSALLQVNRTAGSPFVVTSAGNTGIGTITPQGAFTVVSGNVGIGTWSPVDLFQVNRPSGGPFVIGSDGRVGIGTVDPQTALAITSGNIGIGTWTSSALLQINRITSSPFVVTEQGNVGVGTITPQGAFIVTSGNVGIGTFATGGGQVIIQGSGNVGIGSSWPGATLDVQGTIRATTFVGDHLDKEFWWPGSSTLPLEPAESIATISKDAGTNIDMLVADFDQTTDECRSVTFNVPQEITSGGTVTFSVYWYSGTTTNNVVWDFRHNAGVAEGVDPDLAVTTETAAADAVQGTGGQITITTWTETQTNLGWVAGDLVVGRFCRDANNGSDNHAADARVIGFGIRIPRT